MDGRDGAVLQIDGEWEIRFERRLNHAAQKVWDAITGPGEMSRWFDETQFPDPLAVGAVIRFRHASLDAESQGHITAVDPPYLIEWRWSGPFGPASMIRWRITPETSGCRLILSQTMPDPSVLGRTTAGWHVCLDRLEAILDGGAPAAPGAWPALFARYSQELKNAGLTAPQQGAPSPPPKP